MHLSLQEKIWNENVLDIFSWDRDYFVGTKKYVMKMRYKIYCRERHCTIDRFSAILGILIFYINDSVRNNNHIETLEV